MGTDDIWSALDKLDTYKFDRKDFQEPDAHEPTNAPSVVERKSDQLKKAASAMGAGKTKTAPPSNPYSGNSSRFASISTTASTMFQPSGRSTSAGVTASQQVSGSSSSTAANASRLSEIHESFAAGGLEIDSMYDLAEDWSDSSGDEAAAVEADVAARPEIRLRA